MPLDTPRKAPKIFQGAVCHEKFLEPASHTPCQNLGSATVVEKYKKQHDEEVEKNHGKTKYDYGRKRHVPAKPKWDFYSIAVREFYTDMNDVPNYHPDFQWAFIVAIRAFENIADLRDPASRPVKEARASGGGRKCKAPEIRSALFSWLVNVREALIGCFPKRLFKLKAKELYAKWLIHNPSEPKSQLWFGSKWIKELEDKYGVLLRKPNKRFSIKKEDLVTRIEDFLQNLWTVRNFFIKKYGIDPPAINGDQMPLIPKNIGIQRVGYICQRKLYAFTWKSDCFYPNIIRFLNRLKTRICF